MLAASMMSHHIGVAKQTQTGFKTLPSAEILHETLYHLVADFSECTKPLQLFSSPKVENEMPPTSPHATKLFPIQKACLGITFSSSSNDNF